MIAPDSREGRCQGRPWPNQLGLRRVWAACHRSSVTIAGTARLEHVFVLVPAQQYVGQFLSTFKEFPQRQKVGSFSLDRVLENLTKVAGDKWRRAG